MSIWLFPLFIRIVAQTPKSATKANPILPKVSGSYNCCFVLIDNYTIRLPNESLSFFYRWNRRVPMGPVQLNMNENISMHPTQYNSTESINPMRVPQNNCDLSASIFNANFYGGQTSGTSTTIDPNTIRSISSIRNPLSTFTPTYQSQNGYMSTGPMQTFGAVMNPIQAAHSSTQQQQTISYNQTSFFLPIQGSNSINTAYFNSNDQNSRVNYDFNVWKYANQFHYQVNLWHSSFLAS